MAALTLSPEEREILLHVLERCHYNLRVEIVNTDNREFRRELKKQEVVLQDLIDRLKAAPA